MGTESSDSSDAPAVEAPSLYRRRGSTAKHSGTLVSKTGATCDAEQTVSPFCYDLVITTVFCYRVTGPKNEHHIDDIRREVLGGGVVGGGMSVSEERVNRDV